MSLSEIEVQQFLASIQPFKALPTDDLRRVAGAARAQSFSKGETIYTEGDPADSVWILKEGRIQIFKYSSGGRPHAIENLGPQELFGTLCRMGSNGRIYPCTAVTSTPSTVIRILDRTFLDFYNRFPGVVMGVCSLCSQRLNAMQGVSCAAQEPVERRIAVILLQLQKSHGDTLPFTKREVAELAGTTVETTIRTISAFSKKGWVVSARGKIRLKAPDEIQKLTESIG